MSVKESVKGFVVERLLERPARRQSLVAQLGKLETAGQKLEARFKRAAGTPKDQDALRHIVGIERWGQRRVAHIADGGDPEDVVIDSYGLYRPPEEGWNALIEAFRETRQQTLATVRTLEDSQLALKAAHNDLGPLSVGAWLRYLRTHATLEGRRVKIKKS